ncbi:Rap1 GTPase-GDP dissociation stimulator 1-A [Labeo rohita]|uniref:Rap1 GTPase-GDP dissociation stimulator 1-A n=1 Tax=Labeo rohita TaxID=84645 RepID=A0ABQ8MW82_LABRO|nr:Rap1 GTPase-GDP dissociation stimulator 1-A [Labeo rohita]
MTTFNRYDSSADGFNCEKFLSFSDKINTIRAQVEFAPVSLQICREITLKLKPTFSAHDILPSCFLKLIFDTVGADILHVRKQRGSGKRTNYRSLLRSSRAAYLNSLLCPSLALCEDCSSYFGNKVSSLRPQYQVSNEEISTSFNPVSLHSVKEVIFTLKPSLCAFDPIHPHYLRQKFDTVDPGLVLLFNKSWLEGVKPSSLSRHLDLESLNQFISPQVQYLSVMVDNCLKFDKQISAVIGSSLFFLCSQSKIKPFLPNRGSVVPVEQTPALYQIGFHFV